MSAAASDGAIQAPIKGGDKTPLLANNSSDNDAVEEVANPGMMYHIQKSLGAFKKMTWMQIIGMSTCVFMTCGGMSGQLITLNMWVGSFPADLNINVPFTILTLSSFTNALAYCIGYVAWILYSKASFSFIFTKKAQLLGFGVGLSIALNGIFVVSATAGTPEVLQAFLLSTSILWTFLFVKVLFGEKRSYNSPLIYISFAMSLGGIIVGSVNKFTGGQSMDASTAAWTGLFAFGMVPGAMNGVVSSKFMRHFTLSPEEIARDKARRENLVGVTDSIPALVGSDANSAKFAMLAVGNVWQVICMYALLPVGAIPWFGSSPNMASLGSTLMEGWKCTVGIPEGCGESWIYFFLFNLTFVLSTVGQTFLNYYSPSLTAIITQLASPLTALTLIIVPAWNVTGSAINIPESIAAVILITIGSLTYSAWEESTRHADIVRSRSERSQRIKSGQTLPGDLDATLIDDERAATNAMYGATSCEQYA